MKRQGSGLVPFTTVSIWYLEKLSTHTEISDFHKRAKPPPLPGLGTVNKPAYLILHCNFSNRFLPDQVSNKKTVRGSCARIMVSSSSSASGFPSPRQFQARQLIALGEAVPQPPPFAVVLCQRNKASSSKPQLPVHPPCHVLLFFSAWVYSGLLH